MTVARTAGLESHLRQRLAKKPLLLMTHVVVGYPSLDANWAMLEAMDRAGVDLVELQLPFSEPIADGPSFVKANHDAIQAGTAWRAYFDLAARAATRLSFPIVFMGYYNSVFRMGAERFCASLSETGMRGFILPDLPPEEAAELHAVARWRELDPDPHHDPDELAGPPGRDRPPSVGLRLLHRAKGRDRAEDGPLAGRGSVPGEMPHGDVAAARARVRIRTAADVREVRGLADIAIVGTAGLEAWEERGADGYRRFLKTFAAETV